MGNYMLVSKDDYLMHYGVKGMKWGHRKNPEVVAARQTYRSAKKDWNKSYNKAYNYSARHPVTQYVRKKTKAESDRRWDDAQKKLDTYNKAKSDYKQAKQDYKNSPEGQAAAAKRKKAIKVGAAVAGTALAAYGAYKATKFINGKNAEIMRERGRKAADEYLEKNSITSMDIKGQTVTLGRGQGQSIVTTYRKGVDATTQGMIERNDINSRVAQNAGHLRAEITNSAKDMKFKDKTKNVYNYYRKRK